MNVLGQMKRDGMRAPHTAMKSIQFKMQELFLEFSISCFLAIFDCLWQ